jgi:hypothetical protein
MYTRHMPYAIHTDVSIFMLAEVKNKDIRKYLDGIYCTTRKVMGQ